MRSSEGIQTRLRLALALALYGQRVLSLAEQVNLRVPAVTFPSNSWAGGYFALAESLAYGWGHLAALNDTYSPG